jgi:PPK2 family polyphosphate:nucleotide phosphotransferase
MDERLQFARQLVEPFRVTPGRSIELHREFDSGYTGGLLSKKEAADHLQAGLALLVDYQDRLSAQATSGVLLVLQGIDAAGKDGTIKHVMSGVNPQGVEINNFKEPSAEELRHDFLWRHQRSLPGRGTIGIFNRSHYEEVLVVRVHADLLVAERLPEATQMGDIWMRRYREINDWERHVAENGIRVVKVFLNLSKREQAKRFLKRIDHPTKNWKFSAGDIRERQHWDEYQRAFDQMLSHTSTEWAPWYVIPADHKWFGRLAAAAVLIRALSEIDPQYPPPPPQALQEMAVARADLVAEIAG